VCANIHERAPNRQALFVAPIGVAFAVYSDLPKADIVGYLVGSAALLAANTIVAWFLVGLLIGGILRPLKID
jgi:hypothetical protein